MKCSLVGKKQSLFRLGGSVCLIVILMSGSFAVGRFLIEQNSRQYPTARVFGSSQSSSVSKISHVSGIAGAAMPIAPSLSEARLGSASVVSGGQADAPSTGSSTQSKDIGSQYQVKTLKVDLNVKDTRKVADNLLTWITATDSHATSTGTDYEQVSDNLYNISLTFSVQATDYPQIYRYLRDYTTHNGGRLATFNESVQDVTSSYIDTQSRLKNLRAEQARLQDLYSHAQELSDILSIDQQLTDVEGQIESDEAQLTTLSGQVAFYTVSVSLEPLETATPVPPPNTGWSVGQIFRDAFSASLAFGQGMLGLLIWLLAFGLYIVPFAMLVWLARKWYISTKRAALPKVATDIADLRMSD